MRISSIKGTTRCEFCLPLLTPVSLPVHPVSLSVRPVGLSVHPVPPACSRPSSVVVHRQSSEIIVVHFCRHLHPISWMVFPSSVGNNISFHDRIQIL